MYVLGNEKYSVTRNTNSYLISGLDICPAVQEHLDDLQVTARSSSDERSAFALYICIHVCMCNFNLTLTNLFSIYDGVDTT